MDSHGVERLYKTELEIVAQNQDDIYNSQIRVNQEATAGVDSGQMLYVL